MKKIDFAVQMSLIGSLALVIIVKIILALIAFLVALIISLVTLGFAFGYGFTFIYSLFPLDIIWSFAKIIFGILIIWQIISASVRFFKEKEKTVALFVYGCLLFLFVCSTVYSSNFKNDFSLGIYYSLTALTAFYYFIYTIVTTHEKI